MKAKVLISIGPRHRSTVEGFFSIIPFEVINAYGRFVYHDEFLYNDLEKGEIKMPITSKLIERSKLSYFL